MSKNTIDDQIDKAGIIFHPSDIEMDTERAEYFTQALYQDLMDMKQLVRVEDEEGKGHHLVQAIPVENINQYFGKENQ